jgi:sugar lactone lactonase YvrE
MRTVALALLLSAWSAPAQLPASGVLSEADRRLFSAEIARIERQLQAAPEKHTLTYEMARTWATAKQWPEAIIWLRKSAELKSGFDPSRDRVFADLRGSREFEEILAIMRQATPAVSHSHPAFRVTEGDLVPESVAWDSKGKYFYFGSMKKGKVVRCRVSGECTQFAAGLDVILGLKVHGNRLWLLNNSDRESSLIQYDLGTAQTRQTYKVTGAGHNFNDLAIAPDGEIYLTDTAAEAVWHLAKGSTELARLPGRFPFANGIAMSPDSRLLYVSTYPDGLHVVDLQTGASHTIAHPVDLCLATIDGLYFHRNTLIAIQNASMSPRVIRMRLTRDLRNIDRFSVLERRNSLFDGVTTGVIAGSDFFYMANIQDDKTTGFTPITILKLRL